MYDVNVMPTTATMWQGNDTNNVNTEQKQSVQLHSYMHKHTRATACYIMRPTGEY
jgi:hypothetical protein